MSNRFSADALVVPFEQLRNSDVEIVGGKNASLGEMISQLPHGVRVPTGFATTAHAFREFLKFEDLDQKIHAILDALDTEDVVALAEAGAKIRALVEAQPFPPALEASIREAFVTLSGGQADASFATSVANEQAAHAGDAPRQLLSAALRGSREAAICHL